MSPSVGGQVLRMDSAVTFIVLLGCWTVRSSPSGQSVQFSMMFSAGTRLLLDFSEQKAASCDEDDHPPRQNNTSSSVGPSIQVLSSVQLSQDPGSHHLLVCVLNGLRSPWQQVLWWLNDTLVMSAEGPWTESERGYGGVSVWEVSADQRTSSPFWCGTIQDRQVYRWKLCSD